MVWLGKTLNKYPTKTIEITFPLELNHIQELINRKFQFGSVLIVHFWSS